MYKKGLILVITMLLCSVSNLYGQINEPNFNEIASRLESAIVPIIVSVVLDVPTPTGGYEHKEVSYGSGTGFIISSDGYILTCRHVVDVPKVVKLPGTDFTLSVIETKINILLKKSGISNDYSARVIQTTQMNDVAIIKITAENLNAIELGDSSKVQNLQKILVLGYPLSDRLGVKNITLTTGNITALREDEKIIQISASVNPGNSGGPLVDENGKVIGIIVSKIRDAEGINFATQINVAKSLIENSEIKLKSTDSDNKTRYVKDISKTQDVVKGVDGVVKKQSSGFISNPLFLIIFGLFILGTGILSFLLLKTQGKKQTDKEHKQIKQPLDIGVYDQAWLIVYKNGKSPDSFHIRSVETYIGRNADCDIVLNEQAVSSVHAVIISQRQGFYLEHRSKTNNTYLNGREITSIRLYDADKIKIGNTLMEFRQQRLTK
ncbi:MAG: trypsin-like peptidase domain-containing protein [Nitrospirae bacterium]|nr:trypsin-like peptidase domain-containing protein [Nitrospirota bacterium]